MNEIGPARLATGETWKGDVETVKVRVWADNPYRTQNIKWQATFDDPLELTNVVMTPLFGVKLVAEYQAWDRDVPGATLEDDLNALRERDSGDDVFVVIGLTSSLPLVSATFEQLGLAEIGGRHLMLRGYADLEERKLYANAFPDLRAEERELALDHLRHHKTAVMLLHELGHILGMDHEVEENTIMNAMYSSHATAYSPHAREVMLHSVDQRLRRNGATPAPTTIAQTMPTAKPAAVKPVPVVVKHHDPIVIRLTKKKATIVAGKTLVADALTAMLKEVYADDPTTAITISQDKNLPGGALGDLIDQLKAVGFTKVELAWSGK
jgi:biopolymer transport protein ExbD